MSDTPRTDTLIKNIQAEHKLAGLDDFDHYFQMTGQLALHARSLEMNIEQLRREANENAVAKEALEHLLNMVVEDEREEGIKPPPLDERLHPYVKQRIEAIRGKI